MEIIEEIGIKIRNMKPEASPTQADSGMGPGSETEVGEEEVEIEIEEEIRGAMDAQKPDTQEVASDAYLEGILQERRAEIGIKIRNMKPEASPTPADSGMGPGSETEVGEEEVEIEIEEGELVLKPNSPPRQLPASPEPGICTTQNNSPQRQLLVSPESGEYYSSSDDNNVNQVTPFLREQNNNPQKSKGRPRVGGPNEFPNAQERDPERPLTPPSPIYQDTEQDQEVPRSSYTRCESGRIVEIHETAPSYAETPTRLDIRSRLGPKRIVSVKDRLGSPSIKSRLGQKSVTPTRRVNPWNRWEQSSPWVPWILGREPKCDMEWNRQLKQHLSNILRTQEADNDPRESDTQDRDELGSVSSAELNRN